MNTLRLYGRSMAILIKSQLQYPLSFLMQRIFVFKKRKELLNG